MKPRSKSEWITPAAAGALSPAWIVQARVSFSPVVRYVRRPRRPYTARIRAATPLPSLLTPSPARYSAASSSERSTSSLSIWALMTTASVSRWVLT